MVVLESDDDSDDEDSPEVSHKAPRDTALTKGSKGEDTKVVVEVPLAAIAATASGVPGREAAETMASKSPQSSRAAASEPQIPANASSSSRKPSVSWASDVFERGLTRKLGPELDKPTHISTGLRVLPVAK